MAKSNTIHLRIENDLLEYIGHFKEKNHSPSLSEAIRILLRKAVNHEKGK